ncbi:MAG TPA: YbhB/YbcL family Raf kinase inhibitor-like protein [Polyangia bacterium]|nr:YbhB/YbcL family Raf kinase inhibitor-like protein [Polyangia bacterium]
MTLTSPDQTDGAKFGTMFTCAAMNGTFGAGVNPQLDWSGVPAGTMSFAMTFIDTKIGANMAMGQHWAIWNIPADVRQFPKGTTTLTGALAGAMQTNKYLAPCPSGNDTYEFTLYALPQATLNVSGASGSGTSNSAGVAKVLTALQGVTPLATATLHGTSGPMGK